MGEYKCSICSETFSASQKEELIEHLRDHHAWACGEVDRAEVQLEELGSHPEL